MKTFYAKLSLCFLFGGTAIFISSCGEDKKDDINEVINNIDKPVEDDPVMGNLTAAEQKKRLMRQALNSSIKSVLRISVIFLSSQNMWMTNWRIMTMKPFQSG